MGRKGEVKTGGRKKGTPNKKTEQQQQIIEAAAAAGITPLEFLLAKMADTSATEAVRMDAAKAAAPYVHARLAAIEHAGSADKPVRMVVQWGGGEEPDPMDGADAEAISHGSGANALASR
jgi:hypothetical protein